MREMRTELLVVGGGLGGVAAALTAARLGRTVVLTETTDWLGGQLTAQAVPPDEHPWIEGSAAPPGYAELRRRVRAYYRRNYPLLPAAAEDPRLDPGLGIVSRMCHEPRVAVAVIEEMLAPWRSSGAITVLTGYEPVAAHTDGDRIEAVTLAGRDGHELTVHAAYVADATELGDLLELAGVEHVFGAEGRDETGEPHAPETADPLDQQAVSWCFALEHRPGEDHTIDRPAAYGHWSSAVAPFWPGPQLSFTDVVPITLEERTWKLMDADREAGEHFDLWQFRRVLAREQFAAGAFASDITVVNWPQIDYWEAPLLGVGPEQRAAALDAARGLSLSFLHWLQTEAPRPDGGTGWPGLRLRPDVTGTPDGLAKAPYIRESRRIKAEFTVLEQHVGVAARPPGAGCEVFHDSVGLGSYRIDLHPSTAGRSYVDIESYPFQIPLGALIPVRVDNLLPANKNIGTTHITNGCYRLHPVEWAIGEAVGALAGHCLDRALPPRKVRSDPTQLSDYQRLLSHTLGIRLAWPEEIRSRPHHY
ncbi:FAD dependent oxidoreductase [Streptomyces indicus]|uniref:FAD dependent oxidoreductase n=2 Tax=Streptomyces indicus TaxID=417292 RepID=A0A1G8UVT9_9ACTN|nr:FAD dependent oxidoreductase [Streptomyces indicus]